MRFISESSLTDLIDKLEASQLNPEILIDDFCNKLNNWDNKVKAFIPEKNRRERLHHDLNVLYKKFPDPKKRPQLFGIPIGIKDIFHVDGFITRAGSEIPHEVLQDEEAQVVSKLKQAGALILGKTVTTEFAYFHPGPTCNPHNFLHTPGGSSSGSAAAVSAGFCPLAIGTQTIGSISRPAAFCGIYGFKPSYGRISVKGVIPFSKSADHVGIFTQDINGCELIASLLCENWDRSLPELNRKPIIGIPEGKFLDQASDEILEVFWNAIQNLKQKGLTFKSVDAFDDIDQINNFHRSMIAAEFADVHKDWYAKYKKHYRPATVELIEKGRLVDRSELQFTQSNQIKVRNHLEKLQMDNEIDIWISPSSVTTAPKGLDSTGDPTMNLPWTYAGVPTISIPFGSINQLPFGLQFSGEFLQDEKMFKIINYILKMKR